MARFHFQVKPDPDHEFFPGKGFGEIVAGAVLKASDKIGGPAFGGQHNNGEFRRLVRFPQPFAYLDPRYSGHHDVQQDQVRFFPLIQQGQSFITIICRDRRNALHGEMVGHNPEVDRIILHHENRRSRRFAIRGQGRDIVQWRDFRHFRLSPFVFQQFARRCGAVWVRISFTDGKGEGKGGSIAQGGCHPDAAAVEFHQVFGNGKPQPGALHGTGIGGIRLLERFEYLLQPLLGYPPARIGHRQFHHGVSDPGRNGDGALFGKFDGIS